MFAFVVVALLLTGTLVSVSRVSLAGVAASLDAAAARSLASSAALAYLSETEDQRDALLEGERPDFPEALVLFELDDGRRAIARLLPLGDDERLAVSENAKLDVNTVPREFLASLELVGDELAGRIVSERQRRPFTTLADLLAVEGLSAERLFGSTARVQRELSPLDESNAGSVSQQFMPTSGDPSGAGARGPDATRLSDLLTVYSFDPNVSLGLTPETERFRGERRINLNQTWSDDLREPIADRYGDEAASVVQRLMNSDAVSFDDLADIVRIAERFDLGADQLVGILDGFTTSPDPYNAGLVDVNRATAEVLATLPRFDRDLADRIVAARDTLDADERLSPVWIVQQGLIDLRDYARIADHVTTRSTQWRLRIEAGIERDVADGPTFDGGPGAANAPTRARTGDLTDVPLTHRVVLEVVVDVAAPQARLTELRDLTLLPEALELARLARPPRELAAEGFDPLADADPAAIAGGSDLGPMATENDASDLPARLAARRAARDAAPAGRRSLRDDADGPSFRDRRDAAADEFQDRRRTRAETVRGEAGEDEETSDEPPPEVDRRFGRWAPPPGS